MKTNTKTLDLSQRQSVPINRSVPIFTKQNHAINSIDTDGITEIFSPNGSCTVQRVIVQVLGDTTIQLLQDGVPVSIMLSLKANSVVQFPGLLLPGNSVLALLVSASVTVEFDVTWIKDFCPESLFNHLFIASI